jgi:uncharacterized protein (DUF1684 family)
MTPSLDDLASEVRLYREARLARLTAPTGWLALVNKTWLEPGKSTIGSSPEADIVLSSPGAPAHLGSFTFTRKPTGGEVRFDAAPGVAAIARGAAIDQLVMRSDADPSPDRVTVGTLQLELIARGDDRAVRVRDPEHPARRAFTGIPFYDIDPAWWIEARFEPYDPQPSVELTDNDGRPQASVCPGVALFEVAGTPCRLPLFSESDGQRLFVLFGDATNRDETYGAGRFLYAPWPVGGRVILDFNKAFNPPCAFTPFTACPLPPPGHRLPIRISAGEKRPLTHG